MTGWECPICHRCYSPDMVMCLYCPSVPVTVVPLPFAPLSPYPHVCAHVMRVNGVCVACGHSAPTYYYGNGWVASIMPDGFTTDTSLAPPKN